MESNHSSKKEQRASKEAPAAQDAQTGPVQSFRCNDVHASVFAREHNGKTFYSVSLSRSYKDFAGNRKYAKTFDADDLASLITVARQTSDYLREQSHDA